MLRAYTRLVALVGAAPVHHASSLGLALFAGSIWSTRPAARGLPAGRGQRPRSLLSRRAAAGLAPGRHPGRDRPDRRPKLRERPEVRSVFVNGGAACRPAQRGGAQGHADRQPAPKDERKLHAEARSRREIAATWPSMPDIRFWFLQRQRPARALAGRPGRDAAAVVATRRRELAERAKRQSRSSPTSSPRRRWTGRRCASCRSSTWPPSSASPRKPSPRPCASPPSATSARTSPSSTSATGRCRSACSSTSATRARPRHHRGPEGADDARRRRAAGGRGARSSFGQGPTAIDRYDRVRRVASSADMVGTRRARARRSTAVMELPTAKNLPPGVADQDSPATPRSWTRCSRASRRPWAPA